LDSHATSVEQCNNKFENERKCGAPVLDTNTIQVLFIKAYNRLMESRSQVIANCELARRSLADIDTLDAGITRQLEETKVVAEMVKAAVKESALTVQSHEEYLKKINMQQII